MRQDLNEMGVAASDVSTQDTSTDVAMEVTNYDYEMHQFSHWTVSLLAAALQTVSYAQ